MSGREGDRGREVTTIGVTDLRPPLFVGMRVSFVPDTLTFSRKHSCLHSCSLGRDTHYSPLLPFVPCPPAISPSAPLASYHLSTAGCHTSSPLNARTHTRASRRACVRACVHIPGETLECAAVRANTHACPSRAEEVDNPLALPLAHPLLPFLTSARSAPAPAPAGFP